MDRTLRRMLEERARQLRLRGQLEGWSRDQVVDEILRQLPGISPLEAHRLAAGWTRLELSQALDALYQADGLMPPGISVSEICRWEHGRYRPTSERQEYLTRLYRTRPDRLGFGRDHSPGAPEAGDHSHTPGEVGGGGSPAEGPWPLPLLDGVVGIAAGASDRILSLRWVLEEGDGAELVVELEDGDGDGRAVLRLAGRLGDGGGRHHPHRP
ncbi:MAG TPA: helix-turn-helix transcriptional regulator [Candidatus Dormibacteraeota bacterium]|nr:helix-turn-helix transcriptional regulator [Candidatus Dormibacteraeota bacterium]